ncbi:PP2C family protein-serine/threonine phosphatase [Metamycoplasma equirhinis]|uniref:PP2C family protein-serine/threonine phosphatase n=1 Tax=Metamycoplasma equirhinis TaxID=92402 RepID=UPI0035943111
MKYCIKSDIGRVRKENQDRADIAFLSNWTLAMLCDGMGGHFGGAKCAELTIETLKNYFLQTFPDNLKFNDKRNINKWFNNALSQIKKTLDKFIEENFHFESMGTTLTAALIFNWNGTIYIFNVGDSRTYVYNGLLYQTTQDQNFLNQLVSNDILSFEEAKKHPDANKLVSCIGPRMIMKCDGFLINSDANVKYVILTSDGLHDYVEKPAIEQILQNKKLNLEAKAQKLVEFAIRNSSQDNISIEIVELENE